MYRVIQGPIDRVENRWVIPVESVGAMVLELDQAGGGAYLRGDVVSDGCATDLQGDSGSWEVWDRGEGGVGWAEVPACDSVTGGVEFS